MEGPEGAWLVTRPNLPQRPAPPTQAQRRCARSVGVPAARPGRTGRAGQPSARGCEAAYTSRSVFGVTSV
ncbi:hypothetical protein CAE01nite_28970 [Cellulomonas aerilata]|uniref:Uncharacterized protein n=1 Tax=Cellulomonas aerilata TaxID=515326 RepID=A0A512DFF9_9CELL|nr:hypothetical protein CAE01nite_28970 [Cellulomonas aerilata]